MKTRAIAIAFLLVLGCGAGTKAKIKNAGTGVVACVKADAGAILQLGGELLAAAIASVAKIGVVDWDELVAKAKAQGIETGGCAFAAVYNAFDKQPDVAARSLATATDTRRAALAKLRDELGGAQWQLADGTVVR